MMMNINKEMMGGFGMQEGKRFEYDVLGYIKKSPEYLEEVDILVKKYGKKIPMREVMGLVKEHQPAGWDPTNPPKPFLKDLKLEIGDLLNLLDEDLDKIKTFTAVNSLLDTNFGIDAFLTFKKNDREFFVKYDLTNNPQKDTTQHPDTILITDFTEPPDPKEFNNNNEYREQETAYLEKVEEIAKLSAEQLRSFGV